MALVAILALALAALLPADGRGRGTHRRRQRLGVLRHHERRHVWTWGGNAFGGIGNGDTLPRGSPCRSAPAHLEEHRIGRQLRHGGAETPDGSLWHWGELGIPFTTSPAQFAGE